MKAIWNGQVIAEADKEDLIFIERNWYFPPKSIKALVVTPSSRNLQASGVQGAGEERTETYKEYVEGVQETATQQSAASGSSAGGSADGQASAVQLRESDTPYTCPWKGECQYFDVGQGDNWSKDSAWSYPNPKPSAIHTVKKDFSNYVAFWRDVTVTD